MFRRTRNGPRPHRPNGCLSAWDGPAPEKAGVDRPSEAGFDHRDWTRIEALLRQADWAAGPQRRPDQQTVSRAVSDLIDSMGSEAYVPAAAVTNGLLDLWAAVAPTGRRATRPL